MLDTIEHNLHNNPVKTIDSPDKSNLDTSIPALLNEVKNRLDRTTN